MSDIISLSQRRVAKAEKAQDVSVLDTLRAAISDIENGLLKADSVVVVFLDNEQECGGELSCYHGGAASSSARLGMLTRAQWSLNG